MKAEFKKKWVRALRGESPLGVYTKTKGRLARSLKSGDCFCVVGVLVNEVGTPAEIDEMFYRFGNTSRYTITDRFRKRVGLTLDQVSAVTIRNDGTWNAGTLNFNQLADYIESEI